MGRNKNRAHRRHQPVSVTISDHGWKRPADRGRTQDVLAEFETALHQRQTAARRESEDYQSPSQDEFEAAAADAWHASYGTHVSRALMQRSASTFLPEVVIGRDDRIRIVDTSEYPYSAICSLEITANNGRQFVGTGWLVDKQTVITAGHCVYLGDQGGWARRIRVYPGRNGEKNAPKFTAVRLHSNQGWIRDRRRSADYGGITLDDSADEHGSFGYVVLKDADLLGRIHHVVGYSADKRLGTLWGHLRPLSEIRKNTLIYETDTYGGNSGCPVFYVDRGDVYAVGIHNYGDISGNLATRITEHVFENIQKWTES